MQSLVRTPGIETDDREIRMTAIQDDLSTQIRNLENRETVLLAKEDELTDAAKKRAKLKDKAGVKRKLIEKKRVQQQIDHLRGGIMTLNQHMSVIENTEIDKSLLSTLKAAGQALKDLGVKDGINSVHDTISELEVQLQDANDLTRTLAEGPMNGVVNSMGEEDEDIMAEFNELMGEEIPAVPEEAPKFTTKKQAPIQSETKSTEAAPAAVENLEERGGDDSLAPLEY